MKYKVALVIGNGFDLNLGLKTSYSDFIKEYGKIYLSRDIHANSIFMFLKSKWELHNWIDLELELKKYVSNEFWNIDRSEFEILTNDIREYLLKTNEAFELNDKIRNSKSYRMLSEIANGNPCVILNFNYTNTVDKILNDLPDENRKKIKHIQVHGTLVHNNIIVGVDEKFNEMTKFPFLVKFQNEKYVNTNINEILDESRNIIFFGHSLGQTDHSYFNEFFESITPSRYQFSSDKPYKKGIFLFYHGISDWDNKMIEINKLTDGNFKKFMDASKFYSFNTDSEKFRFTNEMLVKDTTKNMHLPVTIRS